MTAAHRIQVRIEEASACIEAIPEPNHARLILSARRGALQDALADIQAHDETRSRSLALLDGLTRYGPTPESRTTSAPAIVEGWDDPPEDAGDPADGADPEPDPEPAGDDDDDTTSGEAPVAPGDADAGDSGSHPAQDHRGAPTPPPGPARAAAPAAPRRIGLLASGALGAADSKWTPARTTLLQTEYAKRTSSKEILRLVNALPGAKISSHWGVEDKLRTMRKAGQLPPRQAKPAAAPTEPAPVAHGLEDSAPPIPADALAIGVEDAEAVALMDDGAEVALPAAGPSDDTAQPEPDPVENPIYTAARVAKIRELWPQPGHTLITIWKAANAIPAAMPIASPGALRQQANRLGLPDRRGISHEATDAATDRIRAAAMAARLRVPLPPAPKPTPASPPPERTPEQLESAARALLREGYAVAVIAKRTGLTEAAARALETDAEDRARDMLRAGGMSTEDISQAAGLPPRTIIALRREIQQQGNAAA